MNQRATKQDLHLELKIRYKEYFESKLAAVLIDKPEIFSAMAKISKLVYSILKNNENSVLKILAMDPKIAQELYDKLYYGRLKETIPANLTPMMTLNDIYSTLENANSSLDQIMQIHAVFGYRICPKLAIKNEYFAARRDRFKENTAAFFSDRGRFDLQVKPMLSQQFGITKNKVFSKLLRKNTYAHFRALDKFTYNAESSFFKSTLKKIIPFVAGPSHHTNSLMGDALSYGLHSHEDLKEYALACFVFLASGGNHSFHETMLVASKAGFLYEEGTYTEVLPESLKRNRIFDELVREFPDFLEKENKSYFADCRII